MSGTPVSETERILGYRFSDPALLEKALTHSSFSGPDGGENYETLEFLGDAVLELVTRKYLIEEFPGESEGDLTRRKIRIVQKDNLAFHGRRLGLHQHVRVGRGFDDSGGALDSIAADVIESLAGAMFLDSGLNPAEGFLVREILLKTSDTSSLADARSRLQEYCQSNCLQLPVYTLISRTGPDHDSVFTISVKIENEYSGIGIGSSMRLAKEAAADMVLREIGEGGLE